METAGFCHVLPGINPRMPGGRGDSLREESSGAGWRAQGMQLLASWRTELRRRVGIDALVPVSRVAVAPAPVAPAVPVAPLVAPVGGAGLELTAVERTARTSTLLLTYLPEIVLIPAHELIGRRGFAIWQRRRIGQYVEWPQCPGGRGLGSSASRVAGHFDRPQTPCHLDLGPGTPFFGLGPGLCCLRAGACGKRCRKHRADEYRTPHSETSTGSTPVPAANAATAPDNCSALAPPPKPIRNVVVSASAIVGSRICRAAAPLTEQAVQARNL